jgi:hypothetical protein
LRAITSERRCGAQPSDRSPATALHQAGTGVALHDWIGDCAPRTPAAHATTAISSPARHR